MGQWRRQRSSLTSVTAGVIVPPNVDRIAVYLTNLGPGLCHISPEPSDVGGSAGLPLNVNDIFRLYWRLDGDAARDVWYVTDPAVGQDFFLVEELYFSDGE